MSLQLLAKQMEAKGRDGDSVLVHMTPGEVAGLQKLAEAAGGSLSVNPETGLVEANFLKKLIESPAFAPLLGAGLMMIPGVNVAVATGAGALAGGLQAKRKDQNVLTGALMGGLGAYGGASLAGGLTAAGAPAATSAAPTTAVAPAGASTVAAPASAAAPTGAVTPTQAMSNFGLNASNTTLPAAAPVTPVATTAPATFSGNVSQAGQGIANLGTKEGAAAFGKEFGFKQAMAGAAPLLMPEEYATADDEKFKADTETHDFAYDPGYTGGEGPTDSSERRWLNPRFTRMAEGGDVAAPSGLAALEAQYGMSGASKDAYDYLMGRSASSSGRQMAAPAQATMTTPASASSSQEFIFNPATGTFSKNPNYVNPAVASDDSYGSLFGRFKSQITPETPWGTPDGSGEYYGSTGFDDRGPSRFGKFSAAQGGLIGLAKGGMKSGGFVIPADVVSMVGEGNTDAGYSRIKSMVPGATAIKGKDGGQADTVKTSIEGKQPARVAHGEMYVPPETVKRMGGAKKLYAMMDKVRAQATGSKKQIKPVSLKKALT